MGVELWLLMGNWSLLFIICECYWCLQRVEQPFVQQVVCGFDRTGIIVAMP